MRKGVVFPFDLNGRDYQTENEYIQSGVRAWLDIRYFELKHKPYGVDLEDSLFEQIDSLFLDQLELTLIESLRGFTPIQLINIQFSQVIGNSNTVLSYINYRVVESGEEGQLEYLVERD